MGPALVRLMTSWPDWHRVLERYMAQCGTPVIVPKFSIIPLNRLTADCINNLTSARLLTQYPASMAGDTRAYSSPSHGRKRSRNEHLWERKKAKNLRNLGKEYKSDKTGNTIQARAPGPPCVCRRRCYDRVPEDVRIAIFNGYWASAYHDLQTSYIQTHTTEKPIN